jgi:hypothetical protein
VWFEFEPDPGAFETEADGEVGVDGRAGEAFAVDEDAVGAVEVLDPPLALLEGDEGVFAADVAVGDLQFALGGAADVKRGLKAPGLHVGRVGAGVDPEDGHGTHGFYLAICC